MPGFNIHLAIGKRNIEKQKNKKDVIKNENSFYNGLVAPDLVNDKKISHYTTETNKNNLEKYLLGKVRLDLYLKDNKVETDFEKGVFCRRSFTARGIPKIVTLYRHLLNPKRKRFRRTLCLHKNIFPLES